MHGKDEHTGGFEFVGHNDGAFHKFLAWCSQFGSGLVVGAAAFFDTRGDAVKDFHAFEGVFANSGFAAEHDGIRLLEDRVGNVSNFCAGGHGIIDHAFQHMGGHDDGFAFLQAGFDNAALGDWELLVGDFNTEITARNHNRIRLYDDFIHIANGFLVFEFGYKDRFVFRAIDHRPELADVFCFADEGKCDVINFEFEADSNIGKVLGSEGGKIDFDTGEIDVAAAAEGAACKDFALDFVGVLGEDLHFDFPIIDQDGVADGNVVNEVVVINVHGVEFLAGIAANGKPEFLAGV